MQIEDLVQSISSMSSEALEARLREIRHSRTQVKEVGHKPTQRPTKKAEKAADDVLDMFKNLSEDQIAALVESMKGKV